MITVAFLFIVSIHTQAFNSGLVNLIPLGNFQTNHYQINTNISNSNIILSIASFSSLQNINSCTISTQSPTQANISCTYNILSFSYIVYDRLPTITSSVFSYCFFSNDKNSTKIIDLTPFINETFILKPTTLAFISGYQQVMALTSYLNVLPINNNTAINLSRTLNIKAINCTFIIYQNTYLYILTFSAFSLPLVQNSQVASSNIFWGIKQIISVQSGSDELPFLILQTNISIQKSLATPNKNNNTHISGYLIFQTTLDPPNYSTSNAISIYDMSSDKFVSRCQFNLVSYIIQNQQLQYCLLNITQKTSIQILQDNNLDEIFYYAPKGCLNPYLTTNYDIFCSNCQNGYLLMNHNCVCQFKNYQNQIGECLPCSVNDTCELYPLSTILVETSSNMLLNKLLISITLPSNYQYLQIPAAQYRPIVTINSQNYVCSRYQWDNSSNTINITVDYVQANQIYIVQINQIDNISNSFFVSIFNKNFIWPINLPSKIYSKPITTQQIAQNIQPVFTNTDTTVPIILMITFLAGEKINLLSIFQTVSIIYLINFINIKSTFTDLTQIIRSTFIFQPTPIINIVGDSGYYSFSKIDGDQVLINPLFNKVTKNNTYLNIGINSLLSSFVQVILIIVGLKTVKKICQCISHQKSNRVSNESTLKNNLNESKKLSQQKRNGNQQKDTSNIPLQINFNIHRSSQTKEGVIKWIDEPVLSQNASFRQKIILYLNIAYDKKYISFTALLMTQLVSNSFFIFYQFTLPINSLTSLLAYLFSMIVFGFLCMYPFLLYKYEPLHVLKSVQVIYKRRQYKSSTIWIFFCITYYQNILYSLIIVLCSNGVHSTSIIASLNFVKIFVLWKYIKIIDLCKVFLTGVIFLLFTLTYFIDNQGILKELILISILLLVGCEFLKILRSLLIFILNKFKGKQIIQKVSQAEKIKLEKEKRVEELKKLNQELRQQYKQIKDRNQNKKALRKLKYANQQIEAMQRQIQTRKQERINKQNIESSAFILSKKTQKSHNSTFRNISNITQNKDLKLTILNQNNASFQL